MIEKEANGNAPESAYSRIRTFQSSEAQFLEHSKSIESDDGIGVGSLTKPEPDYSTKPKFIEKNGENGIELGVMNGGLEFGSADDDFFQQGPSVYHGGICAYLIRSSHAIFFGSKLNILMLCTPLAILAQFADWPGKAATFVLSLLAIAPFAERLGYVTEQMALYTNDTLGGLLNASFGNATEVIVSLFALLRGRPHGSPHPEIYRRLVQVSLLGSVLSNLLLVLGSALLVGGRRFPIQTYSKIGTTTSMALLFLSVICLVLPAVLENTEGIDKNMNQPILDMSRFLSVLLLMIYGVFLYFQLVTHRHMYEEDGDDDDDEEPVLGFWGGVFWLGVLTVFISVLSEIMVDAIEGTVTHWGVSELFIGAIIIPIVGNAAEHASALMFAYRNKLDITLGVAVGSAVQISVMALPFCVVLGWAIGCPLDLTFSLFEVISYTLTVLIVAAALQDGKTHWLMGIILVAAYIVIGAGFWVQKSGLGHLYP
mmetsp:Transcript_3637/g.4167  ORF Transcript_3637/g.4167 Transcript_3637/m.4167 type:complete len:483 (+) Transcript_3637:113-1561(+)